VKLACKKLNEIAKSISFDEVFQKQFRFDRSIIELDITLCYRALYFIDKVNDDKKLTKENKEAWMSWWCRALFTKVHGKYIEHKGCHSARNFAYYVLANMFAGHIKKLLLIEHVEGLFTPKLKDEIYSLGKYLFGNEKTTEITMKKRQTILSSNWKCNTILLGNGRLVTISSTFLYVDNRDSYETVVVISDSMNLGNFDDHRFYKQNPMCFYVADNRNTSQEKESVREGDACELIRLVRHYPHGGSGTRFADFLGNIYASKLSQ
jgi:hypothetical protein